MKKGIFMRVMRGGIFSKNSEDKLKKKVQKILETKEEKRNFVSLFSDLEPCFICEEERRKILFEATQKYFKIKNEIQEEKGYIL